MAKKPDEIQFPPEKPEIIPGEEPLGPTWPQQEPEINPGTEPQPAQPPTEIPKPPEKSRLTK